MSQATGQQAVLSAIIGAMRRRANLANRSQTRQFLNIGRSFKVDQDSWTGPAIISPDAIFLFRFERTYEAQPSTQAVSRGLLAIPRNPSESPLAIATLSSLELPGVITSHPDWPFPSIRECSVVIVPRELVSSVLYVPGQFGLHFVVGERLLQVGCEVVEPLTVSEFLRNTGWPTGKHVTGGALKARMSTFAFLAGAVGLAALAAVTFHSSINSQLTLLLGLLLVAGSVTLIARAFAGVR